MTAFPNADDVVQVHELARELMQRAGSEHARRAATTLSHPVDGLRQTVIALLAGASLGEHESPGPASLLVIRGRVRLVAGEDSIELGVHQFSPVPNRRHSLHADEDSVVLLSVAVPERAPLGD
jgi:quercetin dioxygenase-like cupin family protein